MQGTDRSHGQSRKALADATTSAQGSFSFTSSLSPESRGTIAGGFARALMGSAPGRCTDCSFNRLLSETSNWCDLEKLAR